MSSGGSRSRGRPKGRRNDKTIAREKAQEELVEKLSEALGLATFEGNSLALMQLIYRNPDAPLNLRFEAAKAAMPFEAPKLSQVEANVSHTMSHEEALAELERDPDGGE